MDIPPDFVCPITLEVLRDPVFTADGESYERLAISRWFQSGHHTSPRTGARLAHTRLVPNQALRGSIESFLAENAAVRKQLQKLDELKKRLHAQPSPRKIREFIDPISQNIMRDPVEPLVAPPHARLTVHLTA